MTAILSQPQCVELIEQDMNIFVILLSFTCRIFVVSEGHVFYLQSWSSSHLQFFLQAIWLYSIFTPSDFEAKSLSEIPSYFGC